MNEERLDELVDEIDDVVGACLSPGVLTSDLLGEEDGPHASATEGYGRVPLTIQPSGEIFGHVGRGHAPFIVTVSAEPNPRGGIRYLWNTEQHGLGEVALAAAHEDLCRSWAVISRVDRRRQLIYLGRRRSDSAGKRWRRAFGRSPRRLG